MRIFKCNVCGRVVIELDDRNSDLMCCGKAMEELEGFIEDSGKEKHLPQVTRMGDNLNVKVGYVLHPHELAHHIDFIILETDQGFCVRDLIYDEKPIVTFKIPKDSKPISVYAYCNIHGLWRYDFK